MGKPPIDISTQMMNLGWIISPCSNCTSRCGVSNPEQSVCSTADNKDIVPTHLFPRHEGVKGGYNCVEVLLLYL